MGLQRVVHGLATKQQWLIGIAYYGMAYYGLAPFWPPKSFLAGKVSLILRMRNIWSLIFYLGRAQPPLWTVLLLICWSFSLQEMNSNCLLWGGPSTSYLNVSFWQLIGDEDVDIEKNMKKNSFKKIPDLHVLCYEFQLLVLL